MAIKPQTDLSAFLASRKPTICAPAAANATPLARLRAIADRNADAGFGYTCAPAPRFEDNAESRAERYFEAGVQAKLCGASDSDALDDARWAADNG